MSSVIGLDQDELVHAVTLALSVGRYERSRNGRRTGEFVGNLSRRITPPVKNHVVTEQLLPLRAGLCVIKSSCLRQITFDDGRPVVIEFQN